MGSGSWGTAFALVVCDAGNQVTLWARRPELADKINFEHRNPDYFPDLPLPASLKAVSDPQRSHERRPTSWCSPCRHSRFAATSVNGRSPKTPSW